MADTLELTYYYGNDCGVCAASRPRVQRFASAMSSERTSSLMTCFGLRKESRIMKLALDSAPYSAALARIVDAAIAYGVTCISQP